MRRRVNVSSTGSRSETYLKSKNTRSSNKSSEYKKNEDGENDDESEYGFVKRSVDANAIVGTVKVSREKRESAESGRKATGMGNVAWNKGGIMVEIQFYGGESIDL